jgi:arginine exporter protein ArgO
MMYIIIFILQFVYVFLRASYIKYISSKKVLKAVIISAILSTLWLIATAVGVKAIIIDSNYLMGALYVLGSVVGTYTALVIEKLKN